MKKGLLIMLLLCTGILCFAQASEKEKNIRKLLELTGSAKLGVQMANSLIDTYKKSYPALDSTHFWDDFMKEIKPEEMIDRIVPVYDKYYTDDDVKQLIIFYQSPVGQKVINTLPQIMQESMQIGQQWGREVAEKLLNRIKEKTI